jgi:hypothetical protein
VDIELIFAEFMEVTRSEESSYRSGMLKNRLEVIEQAIQLDKFEILKHSHGFDFLRDAPWEELNSLCWTEDVSAFL